MKKNIYIVNHLYFNEFFNAPEIVHLLSELPWNLSSFLRWGRGYHQGEEIIPTFPCR